MNISNIGGSMRILVTISLLLTMLVDFANAKDIYGCDNTSKIEARQSEFKSYVDRNIKRKPNPLTSLHTEGTLPHHGIYDESVNAEKDFDIMLLMSFSWLAGIDKNNSFDVVRKYILAWVEVYQPNFNPIDETVFDKFFQAYYIIKPGLKKSEMERIDAFISFWGYGYLKKLSKQSSNDNWQSHRIKLLTLMSVAIHDEKLYNAASKLFKKQIYNNIYSDGHTIDFDKRDALEYTIYDLLPLVQSALVAKGQGDDWYSWESQSGSSLKKGLYWLNPYITKAKTHYEFSNTTQEFDRVRKNAGLGYSGVFLPKSASDLYWSAQLLDKNLLKIAVYTNNSKHAPSFTLLCN